MRVTIIGKQFFDSLAHNILSALRGMGLETQSIDEDALVGTARLRQKFRKVVALAEMHPRLNEVRDRRIVQKLAEFKPDVVICTYANWHPQSVSQARAVLGAKCKILFLYPDATANLAREYPLAAGYDVLFFKDPRSVELFRSHLGINAHYLPEACNPEWHCTVELSDADRARYGCDVTTAGNMYYFRALMLEPLVAHGVDLKIWGGQFGRWLHSPLRACYPGVYVSGEEKAKAFRAAKILVNTLSHKEVEGTNVRTFEAAGCGAFQLADWRPATEDLFKPDEEIVFFRSRDEMIEKVNYYLKHPEQRARIAQAGQQRAHADHTYQKRLDEAFRIAGV